MHMVKKGAHLHCKWVVPVVGRGQMLYTWQGRVKLPVLQVQAEREGAAHRLGGRGTRLRTRSWGVCTMELPVQHAWCGVGQHWAAYAMQRWGTEQPPWWRGHGGQGPPTEHAGPSYPVGQSYSIYLAL